MGWGVLVSGYTAGLNRLIILAFSLILTTSLFALIPASGARASNNDLPDHGNELSLTILYTNDEHGALIPHSPAVDFHPYRENPAVGGYARLAAVVEEVRQKKEAAGEPVLLFSGGDFIGGTAYSWLAPLGYAPELSIKQKIGYDAVIIGNHEYDYGPGVLAKYLKEAGYPEAHQETAVLASNTLAPPDHPLAREQLYRENHLISLDNGLKVGLFGLMGKDAVAVTTANEPVEFSDQHQAARRMVETLEQQGADLIIALTHSGVEEDRGLAADVAGIDVIVGGHCHTALEEPVIVNDTIIVQAGAHLEYVGHLELTLDLSSGTVSIRNDPDQAPFLKKLDHSIPLHPGIDEAIGAYTDILNEYIEEKTQGRFQHILDPVAFSEFKLPDYPPLQETPMGNFVADAMRLVTAEKTGHDPDFAVQANGVIRGSIIPGAMPHSYGKISFYDLVELVGLGMGEDGHAGYPLIAAYLTGDEIRRILEVAVLMEEVMGNTYFLQFSGLRYDYNPHNAVLFTVPFLNLPVPTTRAVVNAEKYTGEGRQVPGEGPYVPIEKGDEELYCLVTDAYIASFLPMVGEMIPRLDVVLKDRDGTPVAVEDIEKLIVHINDEELKVWQAVVEYAADQPVGDSGLPEIEPYYAAPAGRINPVWTIPLIMWPLVFFLTLALGGCYLYRRRKKGRTRLQ